MKEVKPFIASCDRIRKLAVNGFDRNYPIGDRIIYFDILEELLALENELEEYQFLEGDS